MYGEAKGSCAEQRMVRDAKSTVHERVDTELDLSPEEA